MEGNVWQLLVQVVTWLSSLYGSSSVTPRPANGGASPNVPENAVAETSISKNVTILAVTREKETADALFGRMSYNGNFIGFTMERTAVAIPLGTYAGCKRYSPHFGMTVVGIAVPNRTDIEAHPANLPSQLEGCIAVGESIDGDALDNSRAAFDGMMAIVPNEFTVVVS